MSDEHYVHRFKEDDMNTTFVAYFDSLQLIRAELDLHYYDGISSHFKVIDDENNYYEVMIKNEKVDDQKKIYELYVEGLEIGKNYYVVDEHFLKAPLQYRYVVRTDAFDQMFHYSGELGNFYTSDQTIFKIWAPTASRVILDLEEESLEMTRIEKGVFTLTVKKDLDQVAYQYLLNIGSQWHEAIDPYAYASTGNHKKSVVIDLKKTHVPSNHEQLPSLENKTDAIIYELHVRDFSSNSSSQISGKGKYLGLIEEGTRSKSGGLTGIDYLVDLGFTHLQLLPIYDFGSVDEENQFSHYNWGYDPVQYNVPEGSYASDLEPYTRVKELKYTISKLHEKGLRVVMDVVYNHMFDRFTSSFENIVPYYYFRISQDGQVSNGSFCGNDLDSTRLMTRKFIIDSVKRWMTFYGVDGFRFDLMGILDIDTMNLIAKEVEAIDPQALVYGEGWDMPTLLADEEKASMDNQDKLFNISYFNDLFRDTIKGGSMEEQEADKGLMLGDLKHINHLPNLLLGSPLKDNKEFFSAPWKSINYVECHDNQTLFDKMISCGISKDEIVKRHKLILATTLFAQGIPFIHAGQEFLRTKQGLHNSYMSSDEINGIDWNRKSDYQHLVEFAKDAIQLRKDYKCFRQMSYNLNITAKVKKLKKVLEVSYNKETKLLINFTQQIIQIKLKKEKIIFNDQGRTEVENTYALKPLELIIIVKS